MFGFITTSFIGTFITQALLLILGYEYVVEGHGLHPYLVGIGVLVMMLFQIILYHGMCIFYPDSGTRRCILAFIAMQKAIDELSSAEPDGMDAWRKAEMLRLEKRIRSYQVK